jgi:tetratricopeptide (TPR) repeat protein
MDSKKFSEILLRSESNTLDFKRDMYEFSGADAQEKFIKRTEFVKDIISFANTPRDESGYIVIGVKRHSNGTLEKKGISNHIDDNIFQQKMEGWVEPLPRFAYHEITYEELQFGVIEILADRSAGRPHIPTKDSKGGEQLRQSVLYWRRGSKNSESSGEEAKNIYSWFAGGDSNFKKTTLSEPWKDFVSLSNFEDSEQKYVLFLGLDNAGKSENTEALAGIDWRFVADFDPQSNTSGILKAVKPILEQRSSIHIITKGDAVPRAGDRSTQWYFARGIEGRESSLAGKKWTDWLTSYAGDFRVKIEKLAAATPSPIIAIAVWNDVTIAPLLRRCFEGITEAFGENVKLIIVTDNADAFSGIADELSSSIININFRHFFDGLHTHLEKSLSEPGDLVLIPGIDGTEKSIEPSTLAWIEEDLEIVHQNIGTKPNSKIEDRNLFLRGAMITWFDLSIHADLERDKTSDLLRVVRDELGRRQSSRVNLYHRPGAGGSTIGKRILWELRKEFPTTILLRCEPRETVERLTKIFYISDKPLVVLREGNLIADERAEELFNLLKGRQIPVVMIQILRRYELPPEKDRSFSLDSKLTVPEAYRFYEKLSQDAPSKSYDLNKLISVNSDARSAFIFGLTAYQENFQGISNYVSEHLRQLSEVQEKIVLHLSFGYKYGHTSIHKSHFASFLGLPPTKKIDIAKALSPAGRGLLIEEPGGYWRPAHQIIASEIIQQLLSKGFADNRNWVSRLADAGIEFARFCKVNREVQPDELIDLVERVFVYRGDSDIATQGINGDSFSALATDIPGNPARLRLFQALVDIYPDHAHFWAHLGRFYSIGLHRVDDALNAIDQAIQLKPEDNVLHHMRGMALRSAVFDDINQSMPVDEILHKAKQASISFGNARRLNWQDEHGYISEIQLIVRVLDKLGSYLNKKPFIITAESQDPWLREAFQNAESLLYDLRELRRGDRLSKHEEICRGDLDILYGDHQKALERWQNLIDLKDGAGNSLIYAPPIRRQIVWTYLARAQRSWAKVKSKDRERAVDLLNLNIEEEPADEKSIKLWLQVARYSNNFPSVDLALEKVTYWRTSTASIDSVYYTYVLFSIDLIKGSSLNLEKTNLLIEETKQRSRFRRDSKKSIEWFGKGSGLNTLVYHTDLGEWKENDSFWENSDLLQRVNGIVVSLSGPEAGEIEISGGLRAFFVPGRTDLMKGRDLNLAITCFIGFSYEGVRAWSIKRA